MQTEQKKINYKIPKSSQVQYRINITPYLFFRPNMSEEQSTSKTDFDQQRKGEGKTTEKAAIARKEKEYNELLKKVTDMGEALDKTTEPKTPKRSKHRVSISEGDSDFTDWTTATSGSESTDTDTSHRSRNTRRKKGSRRRRARRPMANLLNKHRKTFGELAQQISNPNTDGGLEKLQTLINTMSKAEVAKAVKAERNTYRQTSYANTAPIIKAPKLEGNVDRDIKTFRDAAQSFKDVFRNQITETDASSIHTFLRIASDIATQTRLSPDQLYYLLMSRAPPNSSLLQEIIINHQANTPIKDLFKQLSLLFAGGSSYLMVLKKYEEFNGKDMTCPNFLSSLKTITTNLAKVSNIHKDHVADFTLQKMREKVFKLFPTLAPRILEKDLLSRNGGKEPGTLTDFQGLLMAHAPSIELQLQRPPRKINYIDNTNESFTMEGFAREGFALEGQQVNVLNQEQNTMLRPPRPLAAGAKRNTPLSKPLRLTKDQLASLKDRCYKCAGNSILNPENHYGRNCLLYKNDPLGFSVCSICEQAVHLPKTCKAKMEDQVAKAKELGIEPKLDTMVVNLISSDQSDNDDSLNY